MKFLAKYEFERNLSNGGRMQIMYSYSSMAIQFIFAGIFNQMKLYLILFLISVITFDLYSQEEKYGVLDDIFLSNHTSFNLLVSGNKESPFLRREGNINSIVSIISDADVHLKKGKNIFAIGLRFTTQFYGFNNNPGIFNQLFNATSEYPFEKAKYTNQYIGAAFGYERLLYKVNPKLRIKSVFINASNEFLIKENLSILFYEPNQFEPDVIRAYLTSFQNSSYQTRVMAGFSGFSPSFNKHIVIHYKIYYQVLLQHVNKELLRRPIGLGMAVGIAYSI